MRFRNSSGARCLAGRPGTAAVEFAFLAPLLLLLTLGTVEVTRAVQVKMALADAARHGCRIAIAPGKQNSDVTTEVNAVLAKNNLDPAYATTTIKVNGVTKDVKLSSQDDRITVSITLAVSQTTWVNSIILEEDATQAAALTMMRQR